jgi:hypothetical protein
MHLCYEMNIFLMVYNDLQLLSLLVLILKIIPLTYFKDLKAAILTLKMLTETHL